MEFYKTLSEKNELFLSGEKPIDTFEGLINKINKISNSNNDKSYVFRGQPEAKYKLYNSLQRLWSEKKLKNHYNNYSVLIENLIKHCKDWNNGLILKYLDYVGKFDNDLSYLSIMQHYGMPTPLLDFTYDINKSLFFAIENIDLSPSNSEIENYFSIYSVLKRNTVLYATDLFINKMVDISKEENDIITKNLKTTMQFEIVLVDNTDIEYRIQNNLNIINQDGAFIFNSSPSEPLEIQYISMKKTIEHFMKRLNKPIEIPKEVGVCLNINKKLIDQIITYLESKGINKNTIYPNLNNLKNECLSKEWKQLNT